MSFETNIRQRHTGGQRDEFKEDVSMEKGGQYAQKHKVDKFRKRAGKYTVDDIKRIIFSPNSIAFILVTFLAIITRFYRIDQPSQVVFDEVHFGKFASYYLQRTYFFDVHPPLAKLMLAAMGYVAGFDGEFKFENIGDDYVANNVPYIALRSLPATLGALAVSLVFLIMRESGYPLLTSCLAAIFVMLDNALVTQTRLILLDSMLMFFALCATYCYVRFYKLRHREFTTEWWTWMVATGVTLSLTLSIKMVGLFTFITMGIAVIVDLWNLLDYRRGLSMRQFGRHFFARTIGLIIVPIFVYVFWFYVHFSILTLSGPGDAFMSSEFQETLAGNPLIMNSLEVHYGDNITIQHKDTKVFLHSHLDRYPLRYEDGRISSQGQQVTGYTHHDPNNYWRIWPAEPFEPEDVEDEGEEKGTDFETEGESEHTSNEEATAETTTEAKEDQAEKKPKIDTNRIVKHGDIVRLQHIYTGSFLLTHDVASPLMPTNQEITTTPPSDVARYNQTLFQVLIDGADDGTALRSAASQFRLIHMETRVAVWTHAMPLPEWGFKQQEVNGNKNIADKTNYWTVDEIVGKNATEINMAKKKTLRRIPFYRKFLELQQLMISHNARLTSPHPYQSAPITWPFLLRGISFWTENNSRKQIYLLGNPFGWWIAVGGLAVFAGIVSADVLGRRRGIEFIEPNVCRRLYRSAGFLFVGWAAHYFPFFLMGRSLFLHHYLPALIYSYMVLASVFNFVFTDGVNVPASDHSPNTPFKRRMLNRVPWYGLVAAVLLVLFQLSSFVWFAPMTYGTQGLEVDEVLKRKWLDSWDYHFAK
ncbi:uncharacterized protein VTP21DRAFT_10319 [Calcarisporiella thermophila]|uniref:uncharacterized protein n=1 Tax=Calcarisporiella thermophila TaxID=911321 RepID=UPI0037434719